MPTKTNAPRMLKRIADDLRMLKLPCALCGHDIDYTLPHTDPMSFTVDHIKPRRFFPELANDPNNCQPAHAICNGRKSDGAPEPIIGMTSRNW